MGILTPIKVTYSNDSVCSIVTIQRIKQKYTLIRVLLCEMHIKEGKGENSN